MTDIPHYPTLRFLIVDDDPFLLETHERLLKQCKPAVLATAHDGGSALRAVKDESGRFDCIISDFDMKPLNGLQLLSAIRLGVNPAISRGQRVIMLTGNLDAEVKEAASALDVNAFITKPARAQALYQAINRVIQSPERVKPVEVYRAVKLPLSMARR